MSFDYDKVPPAEEQEAERPAGVTVIVLVILQTCQRISMCDRAKTTYVTGTVEVAVTVVASIHNVFVRVCATAVTVAIEARTPLDTVTALGVEVVVSISVVVSTTVEVRAVLVDVMVEKSAVFVSVTVIVIASGARFSRLGPLRRARRSSKYRALSFSSMALPSSIARLNFAEFGIAVGSGSASLGFRSPRMVATMLARGSATSLRSCNSHVAVVNATAVETVAMFDVEVMVSTASVTTVMTGRG